MGHIHQFSAAQIMDMVQKGYNSLNPKDVKNYLEKKPPLLEENLQLIGGQEALKRGMGESHMNDNVDFGQIQQELGYDPTKEFYESNHADDFDYNDVFSKFNVSDDFVDIKNKMKTYDKLKSKSLKMESFDDDLDESEYLISKPEKNLIKNKKEAYTLGYNLGIEYINEFITLLKNPKASQRKIMIQKLLQLQKTESEIHKSVLAYYKGGIAKSEKELYSKIKSKK